MEPTTPCVTNTLERTPTFRQPNFSGKIITWHTYNQGETTGEASSISNNHISTPHKGSSLTKFKMAGHDPTIILPEFQGEASKDPEKHLFIYEKIWEAKQIIDEDTKLTCLAITLRGHVLDWYMSLDVNSPPVVTKTIADVKKILINKFQKPISEY
jgi:hypothetical protein